MSEYRDHAFINPSVQIATLAWDVPGHGIIQGKFAVLAEPEDIRTVAKICFVSWQIGPGRKIILGRKALGRTDGDDLDELFPPSDA